MSIHLSAQALRSASASLRICAPVLAILLLSAGLWSICFGRGLCIGADLAGGISVRLSFARPVPSATLQARLAEVLQPDIVLQDLGGRGTDFLVSFRRVPAFPHVRPALEQAIAKAAPDIPCAIGSLDATGPRFAPELAETILLAFSSALVLSAACLAWRFEGRRPAACAMGILLCVAILASRFCVLDAGTSALALPVLAMAVLLVLRLPLAFGAVLLPGCNVLATLGILSMLGIAVDIAVLAALAAVMLRSLSDAASLCGSLQNSLRASPDMPLQELAGQCFRQTIQRALPVGGAVAFACLPLLLLGSGAVWTFAATLAAGAAAGILSSICCAASLSNAFGRAVLPALKHRLSTQVAPARTERN